MRLVNALIMIATMEAENIIIDIKVDGAEKATKTLGDLKNTYKLNKEELNKLAPGTELYNKLLLETYKIGNTLKAQRTIMNGTLIQTNILIKIIANTIKATSSMMVGLTAITSLLAGSNSELILTMAKLQTAMALASAVKGFANSLTSLLLNFQKLNAIIAGNPLLLWASAIAAVVGIVMTFIKTTDNSTKALKNHNDEVARAKKLSNEYTDSLYELNKISDTEYFSNLQSQFKAAEESLAAVEFRIKNTEASFKSLSSIQDKNLERWKNYIKTFGIFGKAMTTIEKASIKMAGWFGRLTEDEKNLLNIQKLYNEDLEERGRLMKSLEELSSKINNILTKSSKESSKSLEDQLKTLEEAEKTYSYWLGKAESESNDALKELLRLKGITLESRDAILARVEAIKELINQEKLATKSAEEYTKKLEASNDRVLDIYLKYADTFKSYNESLILDYTIPLNNAERLLEILLSEYALLSSKELKLKLLSDQEKKLADDLELKSKNDLKASVEREYHISKANEYLNEAKEVSKLTNDMEKDMAKTTDQVIQNNQTLLDLKKLEAQLLLTPESDPIISLQKEIDLNNEYINLLRLIVESAKSTAEEKIKAQDNINKAIINGNKLSIKKNSEERSREKSLNDWKLKITNQYFDAALSMMDESSAAAKSLASILTIINTASAVMGIAASLSTTGLAAPALIAAAQGALIAQGAALLATIWSADGSLSSGFSSTPTIATPLSGPSEVYATLDSSLLLNLLLPPVIITDRDILTAITSIENRDNNNSF